MPLLYLFTALLNRLLGSLVGRVRRRVRKREALPNPKVLPIPVRLLFMALMIRWVLSSVTFPLLAREFWTGHGGGYHDCGLRLDVDPFERGRPKASSARIWNVSRECRRVSAADRAKSDRRDIHFRWAC